MSPPNRAVRGWVKPNVHSRLKRQLAVRQFKHGVRWPKEKVEWEEGCLTSPSAVHGQAEREQGAEKGEFKLSVYQNSQTL